MFLAQVKTFLISTLNGCEWSASLPDRFTLPEIVPTNHWLRAFYLYAATRIKIAVIVDVMPYRLVDTCLHVRGT